MSDLKLYSSIYIFDLRSCRIHYHIVKNALDMLTHNRGQNFIIRDVNIVYSSAASRELFQTNVSSQGSYCHQSTKEDVS